MTEKSTLRRVLEIGGIAAGVVMVGFGIAAIYMGADGRSTVQDNLANEFIVGSDDMTPDVIAEEIPGILESQDTIAAERQQAGAEPVEFTRSRRPTVPWPVGDRQRHPCAVLRRVPPHPRPAVLERPDVLSDGPLHGCSGCTSRRDRLRGWHEQRGSRADRRARAGSRVERDPCLWVTATACPRR